MGNWLSDKYAEGTIGPPALRRLREWSDRGKKSTRRRARSVGPCSARTTPTLQPHFRYRREPGRVLLGRFLARRVEKPFAAGGRASGTSNDLPAAGLGSGCGGGPATHSACLGMALDGRRAT